MTIAKNNYKPNGALGIRVLIGVVSHTYNWDDLDLIFVDPEITEWNMSAKYRPLEKVKWWFDSVNKASTITVHKATGVGEADWTSFDSTTLTYSKASTYSHEKDEWTTSASR